MLKAEYKTMNTACSLKYFIYLSIQGKDLEKMYQI